jgi:uncharacterized PurR-regulated membrane protein YhhQ (DUF165 family)
MRKVTSHLMSNNAVSADSAVYFVPDYLDVPAYDRWRRNLRRRIALIFGGAVLAGIGAALLG